MKKIIVLLLSFSFIITVIPFLVYADSTPKISLEEFTDAVNYKDKKK